VATSTYERTKVELSVAAIANDSRLLVEGEHLPCSDIEISVAGSSWTTIRAEFAPKRPDFETVIEGEFYDANAKTVHDLRLTFGPNFTKSSVQLDGEDRYCMAASVRVCPKDRRTYVTLEEVYTVAEDGTTSKCEEITGYLIAR
jgi:hypothetical protein